MRSMSASGEDAGITCVGRIYSQIANAGKTRGTQPSPAPLERTACTVLVPRRSCFEKLESRPQPVLFAVYP